MSLLRRQLGLDMVTELVICTDMYLRIFPETRCAIVYT